MSSGKAELNLNSIVDSKKDDYSVNIISEKKKNTNNKIVQEIKIYLCIKKLKIMKLV